MPFFSFSLGGCNSLPLYIDKRMFVLLYVFSFEIVLSIVFSVFLGDLGLIVAGLLMGECGYTYVSSSLSSFEASIFISSNFKSLFNGSYCLKGEQSL